MNRKFRLSSRALARPAAALLLLALASGCFNPFDPRVASNRGVSKPPPPPSSAEGVVRLFEWCWNNQAINEYEEIFTADFRFQFALTDTAGNAYRDHASTREDEIETARHLFVGGSATEPPANKITLTLDQNLFAQIDSRPGKQDSTYHREILSQVNLFIDTDAEDFNVTGAARFFVIRGDSALIPDALTQKGFRPDPKRWYIERWEDETVGSLAQSSASPSVHGLLSLAARQGARGAPGPTRATGTSAAVGVQQRPVTWGCVKRLFDPRH